MKVEKSREKCKQNVLQRSSRERKHICDCGKKFLSLANLRNHKQTVHVAQRSFSCNHCSKAFKSLNNLHTHEVVHDEKSYLCRFCDKTFARLQDVRIHEKIHFGQKDFSCSECNKSFSQQSNLLSHIKSVSCRLELVAV